MGQTGKRYYLISTGSYSDYEINYVTDDPEKAKTLAELVSQTGWCYDARIEEYQEPDVEKAKQERECYYWDIVLFDNGDLKEATRHTGTYEQKREVEITDTNQVTIRNIRHRERLVAEKIARDIRAEMLAQKYGY